MLDLQPIEVLVVQCRGCGSRRISVILPCGSRNIAWFPDFAVFMAVPCFTQKCYRICCICTLVIEYWGCFNIDRHKKNIKYVVFPTVDLYRLSL